MKRTEQQSAELLEQYLSSLEAGKAFVVPKNINSKDTELIQLMRLGKELRIVGEPIEPSQELLNAYSENLVEMITPQKVRRFSWHWLLPLPLVGAAVAFTLWLSNPQTSQQTLQVSQDTGTTANTARTLTSESNTNTTSLAEFSNLGEELTALATETQEHFTEVEQVYEDTTYNDEEINTLLAQAN